MAQATTKRKDYRTINVANQDDQDFITNKIRKMIDNSKRTMTRQGMPRLWEENAMYVEGYQTPVGYNNSAIRNFANTTLSQSPYFDQTQWRVKKDENNKIYFVDNKIGNILDVQLGEYTSIEKVMNVKDDENPYNNKIERVVQNTLKKIEDKKQLWEQVRVPSIRNMFMYGIGWTHIWFDPFVNVPRGDIQVEYLDPYEVLIDPTATKAYFTNAKFIVTQKAVLLEEAIELLSVYNVDESRIQPDNEFFAYVPNSYKRKEYDTDAQYVTIYHIEYRQPYVDDVDVAQQFGVGEGDIRKERNMYYFSAIYVPSAGTVTHYVNPYTDIRDHTSWQFSTIPYYNKKSDLRVMPTAEIEKFKNVQDIINIYKSLMLDDARERARAKYFIKSRLFDKYKDIFNEWIAHGGFLPVEEEDLRTAVMPADFGGLPKEVYQFVQVAEQSLQQMSATHQSLAGAYPDQEMSGVGFSKILGQSRKILNYKDINIGWAITQEARYLYRIMAKEFTENDFIEVEQKSLKSYSPISTLWTFSEYEMYLNAKYPELEVGQAAQLFESENIVEYQYAVLDEQGEYKDPEEIKNDSGIVLINYLTKPDGRPFRLDIRVSLDYDSERMRIEDRVVAGQLLNAGKFSLKRYFELLGGYFAAHADEIVEEVRKENRILEMGQAIIDNNAEQAVAILLEILNQSGNKMNAEQAVAQTIQQLGNQQ